LGQPGGMDSVSCLESRWCVPREADS